MLSDDLQAVVNLLTLIVSILMAISHVFLHKNLKRPESNILMSDDSNPPVQVIRHSYPWANDAELREITV